MTILFTIILIVVFTAFCGALAFVAPGLSKTMLTEKAKRESQIPDADRGQKIKGYSLYALAGGCFLAILIWAGIDGVRSGMTWWMLWIRFAVVFLILELYDDLFLDWFVFTKTGFFGFWISKVNGKEPSVRNTEPQWDGKEKMKLIAVPFGTLLLALIFSWLVK